MTSNNTIKINLLIVFGVALAVRVIYMILMTGNLGLDGVRGYAADSNFYYIVADAIFSEHPAANYCLMLVGPGYGFILGLTHVIFGKSYIFPILINVLLGAGGAVCIYIIANNLFESRSIALIAGLFNALSHTAISLSNQLLADQPFFFFGAAALASFTAGMKSAQYKWYIWAGILGGMAVYIKSSAKFWPLLILTIVLMIPLQKAFASRKEMFKRAIIFPLIMLLFIGVWMVRNYAVDGLFIYDTNATFALRSRLAAQAVAMNTTGGDIAKVNQQWDEEDGYRQDIYIDAYHKAREKFSDVLRDHPGWVLDAFRTNVDQNIRAYDYYTQRQIKEFATPMAKINWHTYHWLGWVILAAIVFGMVLMLIRKHYFPAAFLGIFYLYHTCIIGFSYWQGSRLHYTAEIFGVIAIAYLLVELNRLLVKQIKMLPSKS